MSQMKEKNQLLEADKKRSAILRSLIDQWPVITGSYDEGYRRCGKSNCWCQNGKGHLLRRVRWIDNGVSRSKTVKPVEKERIFEAIKNYKIYRDQLKELAMIEVEIKKKLKLVLVKKTNAFWQKKS